jgi:zinc/manganese transport system substrate-binding protein
MQIRHTMLKSLVLAASLLFPASSFAQETKIPVVASFSILGDFVKNIGGDRVNLTTLVAAGADAHVYSPTPNDAQKLLQAKIVFINGLRFESWMDRLVTSSGTNAKIITTTKGIKPLETNNHDEHGLDPHAWQNIANAKIYSTNIRDALIAVDPAGKATYETNTSAYIAKLDALEVETKAALAKIPASKRKIITSHDAFGYFAKSYNIEFIAPQGISTDAEASAKDVARIIRQIKSEKITAIFVENMTDPRLIQRIATETSAKSGGTIFSDSLSDDKGKASTYIDMMRHNVEQITQALN